MIMIDLDFLGAGHLDEELEKTQCNVSHRIARSQIVACIIAFVRYNLGTLFAGCVAPLGIMGFKPRNYYILCVPECGWDTQITVIII